jgi:hypothetical protein
MQLCCDERVGGDGSGGFQEASAIQLVHVVLIMEIPGET